MVKQVTPNGEAGGGVVKSTSGSQKFIEAFGHDSSDVVGSIEQSRYGKGMGGGMSDISHSIKGASANLSGTK